MKDTTVTEAQVVEYLNQHPEFFINHPQLLGELSLPHESGSAISLVERQVAVLRERNMDMRHRLSKLLDNARDNDRLFDKTRRLVLALLEGQTLADRVDALLHSFEHDYQIHFSSLILFGDSASLPTSAARVVSMHQAREHIGQILKNNKPVCGALEPTEVTFLFPAHGEHVGSVALVPLIHGNTFGLLAIGNRDPQYYRSSMGTLFLSYIGEVLSRILPQQLSGS
ncbi:MAG: DUF484 family protein [Gammaproteobacteria bacterium]|uniref:DUF484 family protein n=1 Tax=Pseudomaricurvus alcaniphilus TaxID=1166482 RepID=UPI00140D1D3B|nr:DUF484 family protein [Pseudomaricurvus alcaniphilus]MBR9909885.1 DUF484 family protein [Gammaproteobacteria bacterium]NHN38611.1 DUF484 family protein [Pseudomaricurvus alcaniphilus]